MEWTPTTDSGAILGFGYRPESRALRVTFVSGESYDYLGASPKLFQRMRRARSKGTFFSEHIRDRYPFRKVHK